VIKRTLLALAFVCFAILAFSVVNAGEYFRDPHSILWRFAAPLTLALLCLAFVVLPATGRLALGSALVTVGLIEGFFALLNASQQPQVETYVDPGYYQEQNDLGWAPRPGITTRASKCVDGVPIYDVEYAIDDRGRRITPVASTQGRTRFVLFFGCSCTFGEGLAQTETLPFFVSKGAPRIMPYNYGFHGYGPQHLLARLESGSLRGEVEEREGDLVYLFIDSHVNRAIGSLAVYNGWAHSAPNYVIDASGEHVRRGTLTTGRPLTALAYSLLGSSQVLRHFRVEVPPVITDDHVEFTARIFARSAALFHEQFGPGRFVVVISPGSTLAGRLGSALERLGVESLDYSQLFDYQQPEYHLPEDWHPTAKANQVMAERLDADLADGADPSR
jgi:hypothetical protein